MTSPGREGPVSAHAPFFLGTFREMWGFSYCPRCQGSMWAGPGVAGFTGVRFGT